MKIAAILGLLLATTALAQASNPKPAEWSAASGQVSGSFSASMRVERRGNELVLRNGDARPVIGAILESEVLSLSGAVRLSVRFEGTHAAQLGLGLSRPGDQNVPVDAMFVFDPLGGVRIDAVLRHPAGAGGSRPMAQRSSARFAPAQ